MKTQSLAPIVLFAYKRPDELGQTIKALRNNYLASQSELYVFIDGPKNEKDLPKVNVVRQLVSDIKGFKNVYVEIAEKNIGCADSIITGITKVLDTHNAVIVVEDDIVTVPTFLDFMNSCLSTYSSNQHVYSVTGYTFPFRHPKNYEYDAYFIPRHNPWGWATWADRWQKIDWNIKDFDQFMLNKEQQKQFLMGGADVVRMLRRQMEGHIDAWDIRFCYNRFKAGAVTVYPTISKVQNIGFTKEATHTNVFNRYKTRVDNTKKRIFNLPAEVHINKYYHSQYLYQYSFMTRLRNRLKTYIGMK